MLTSTSRWIKNKSRVRECARVKSSSLLLLIWKLQHNYLTFSLSLSLMYLIHFILILQLSYLLLTIRRETFISQSILPLEGTFSLPLLEWDLKLKNNNFLHRQIDFNLRHLFFGVDVEKLLSPAKILFMNFNMWHNFEINSSINDIQNHNVIQNCDVDEEGTIFWVEACPAINLILNSFYFYDVGQKCWAFNAFLFIFISLFFFNLKNYSLNLK